MLEWAVGKKTPHLNLGNKRTVEHVTLSLLAVAALTDLYGQFFSPPTAIAVVALFVLLVPFLPAHSRTTTAADRLRSRGIRLSTIALTLSFLLIEILRRKALTPGQTLRSINAEDNAAWISQLNSLEAGGTLPLEFGTLVSLFLAFVRGFSILINVVQPITRSELQEAGFTLSNAYSILLISVPFALYGHTRLHRGQRFGRQLLHQLSASVVLYGLILLTASYGHLTACLSLWLLTFVIGLGETSRWERNLSHRLLDRDLSRAWLLLALSCSVWRPLSLFGVLVFVACTLSQLGQSLLNKAPRLALKKRASMRLLKFVPLVICSVIILFSIPTVLSYTKFGGGTLSVRPELTLVLLFLAVAITLNHIFLGEGRRVSVKLLVSLVSYSLAIALFDLVVNGKFGYGSTKLWWVIAGVLSVSILSGVATLDMSRRIALGFVVLVTSTIFVLQPEIFRATWIVVQGATEADQDVREVTTRSSWYDAPWQSHVEDRYIAGCVSYNGFELMSRFEGYRCSRFLSSVSQLGIRHGDPPSLSTTSLLKEFGLGYSTSPALVAELLQQAAQLNYFVLLLGESGEVCGATRLVDFLEDLVLADSNPERTAVYVCEVKRAP